MGKEEKMEGKTEVTEVTEPTQTFDDLLKSGYQSEFDRRVTKALETAKEKWQKEAEKKRTEAEALARMSEEEKHQHELKILGEERNKAVAELNAYKLREQATKIATEKGLDVSLLDLIDYSSATAEDVKAKLEIISESVNKATEKAVSERLQQKPPKNVEPKPKKAKELNRASY